MLKLVCTTEGFTVEGFTVVVVVGLGRHSRPGPFPFGNLVFTTEGFTIVNLLEKGIGTTKPEFSFGRGLGSFKMHGYRRILLVRFLRVDL